MLASGFCFNGGRLLAEDCITGGLVSARRNSSGGGVFRAGGTGESRVGGGESRVGSGAAFGLLRGGLSTLLIAGTRGDETGALTGGALDKFASAELAVAGGALAATGELACGELAGAVGRLSRASISS